MDWKAFFRKVLFPPVWVALLLTVVSGVGLAAVFLKGWNTSAAAPVVYVLSFYALTVVCMLCWKVLPGYWKETRKKIYENPYANRYLTDRAYKMRVGLWRSLTINLAYAAFNAVSALVYHTWWFALFAMYYAVMALMRFGLLRSAEKEVKKQLRRVRWCAWLLLTVNLALTGAVLMMVFFRRGFAYHGILIYVMAMYTFYITTMAVVDLVRYRDMESPVLSMSGILRLAAALMSMLCLESAMFAQFGSDMSWENQRLMLILTGGGIAVVVTTLAIVSIVTATKELRSFSYDGK